MSGNRRHGLTFVASIVLLAACAPSSKSADTTATLVPPPPDTVKPVVASVQPGSQSAATSDTTKHQTTQATKSKRTGTKQTTSTQTKSGSARDTAHLGRDSVMIFDPKDPRRQLPPVKKPPR